MPIYIVTDSETKTQRLVLAKNPAKAIDHCTTPRFTATRPEPIEMLKLLDTGIKVES